MNSFYALKHQKIGMELRLCGMALRKVVFGFSRYQTHDDGLAGVLAFYVAV